MPHGGRGVSVAKDIMLEGKVRCDEKRGDECIIKFEDNVASGIKIFVKSNSLTRRVMWLRGFFDSFYLF